MAPAVGYQYMHDGYRCRARPEAQVLLHESAIDQLVVLAVK
jgi:hypothetical protein